MLNPIQQAIADHRRAFAEATQADAPIEAWRVVDCCAWGLLETAPASLDDLVALLAYISAFEHKQGPNMWPEPHDGGDSFTCQLHARIGAALLRLR